MSVYRCLESNKISISEYDGRTRLRQTLIDFYLDMVELYERVQENESIISYRRSISLQLSEAALDSRF